ncbi:hypothetical protein E8E14_001410 [Neopestalotiopsis sp. 37M]|nr:hypothetical protein E8E14_001410 [Neopestalotiopsis sp. 37M]
MQSPIEANGKSPDSKASPAETASVSEGTGVASDVHLRREFKERHISMIAVAGAIGTGLIIGSGTGLVRGGPASLLIAYCIVGAVVFLIMTALGEMATFLPMDKGFAGYATRFVDPALGFATGWNYFFKYAIVLPNNLTAAGIIIQYWRPDLNVGIFVATFTIAIVAVNILHVSFFGEAEFWMSVAKLLVLVLLILTCFIISMGGQPSGERIGFKYWSDPGAFGTFLVPGATGKFLGFWACMVQACFAYTGTEVVGVAFGEAPNPKKTVARAAKQTLFRITTFYILGALVLGMSVPYTNDQLIGATHSSTGAAASPFVVAVQLAKIPVFPHVINACLLVFVVSAANSDIYIGSRTLFGLAHDGQAPGIFRRTSKNGVPLWGVAMMSIWTVLAYMNVSKDASTVFGYLVSLVTVFGTLNWISCLLSYIQFTRGMKAQGISRELMPYRGPLQPYGSYFALMLTVLITFFNGYTAFIPKFTASTFVTSYIGIMIYILNIVFWKYFRKTQAVGLHEMDLHTGRIEE